MLIHQLYWFLFLPFALLLLFPLTSPPLHFFFLTFSTCPSEFFAFFPLFPIHIITQTHKPVLSPPLFQLYLHDEAEQQEDGPAGNHKYVLPRHLLDANGLCIIVKCLYHTFIINATLSQPITSCSINCVTFFILFQISGFNLEISLLLQFSLRISPLFSLTFSFPLIVPSLQLWTLMIFFIFKIMCASISS